MKTCTSMLEVPLKWAPILLAHELKLFKTYLSASQKITTKQEENVLLTLSDCFLYNFFFKDCQEGFLYFCPWQEHSDHAQVQSFWQRWPWCTAKWTLLRSNLSPNQLHCRRWIRHDVCFCVAVSFVCLLFLYTQAELNQKTELQRYRNATCPEVSSSYNDLLILCRLYLGDFCERSTW